MQWLIYKGGVNGIFWFWGIVMKFFLIIKVIIVLTLSLGLVDFELLVLPLGLHYNTLCEVRKDVRALAGIFNDKMKVLELYFASKKGSQQWHSLSHL